MRRLRVIRLLPALDFGGVESRATLQSRLHTREEFELRVCTFDQFGAAGRNIRESGVPVDVLGVSPAVRNPRASLALARYLRNMRPDILHASIAEANFHALAVAPFVRSKALIVEETGMPSHGRSARLAFSMLYRRASAVVGVTQAVCDYIRDVDRAPRQRVELVYNCAHPDFFPAIRREPTASVSKRILLVGRLVPVKNQSTLIEAFAKTLERHPDARLSIVGEGPLRTDLERRVGELGVGGRVEFLGYRDDVRDLLGSARAFALPSLSEGCSISLIEAMSTGVPVIGSDVPGIREVMGDELAQQWTAPAQDVGAWAHLLSRVLELPEHAVRAVAVAAQERAYEMFAPVAYVQRVERLYRRLVPSPSVEVLRSYG